MHWVQIVFEFADQEGHHWGTQEDVEVRDCVAAADLVGSRVRANAAQGHVAISAGYSALNQAEIAARQYKRL